MHERSATIGLGMPFAKAYARKWSFLAVFLVAFFGSFSLLLSVGFVPNAALPADADVAVESANSRASEISPLVADGGTGATALSRNGELPVSVKIPAINLSAEIANPTTTVVSALDTALLRGAVRYPTSARLGEEGNVVLFAHSSYLPVVNNQAYKTFDGIQNLKAGDRITVYSPSVAYTYAVRGVERENISSAAIPLSVAGRVLTLSTCDSFGKKSDRFIVTADFVGSHPSPVSS